MRYGMPPCTSLAAVAIVLGAFSFSAAQTPTLSRAPTVPRVAAPRAAPQCNSATAVRPPAENAVSTVVNATRPRAQYWNPFFFHPFYSSAWNYRFQPRYDPRYYPSYSPLEEEEERPSVRISTYADRKRAAELIERGDTRFARRQYTSAVARYKEAIRIAPDVAEARLRMALALIAQRKYGPGAAALSEALELRDDWSDSQLHLDQLYGAGELAKTTKALNRLVDSNPMNAEFALALGVQLFFSDRREEAGLYFTRAAQLGADKDDRLRAFRPPDEVARGGEVIR